MPAPADTRAPLPHHSRRTARFVLLAALGAGLAGLALPGSPESATAAPTVVVQALADAPHLSRPLAAVRPLPLRAVPTSSRARLARSRASRSRSLAVGWVRPVAAGIDSPYGMRWGHLHPGVDFAARYGAPIHAVGAGVVIGAGYLAGESGYGQIILIRHAGGVVTAYAHTSRMFVHAGEQVQTGEVIALVGATGEATGPHLHFEVRIDGVKIDPVPWLRAHGVDV